MSCVEATLTVIRLSLCIATFKRGTYIAQTLDTIVPQLREDVEVVVLDGASPDDTAEIVESYAARHPAIRYIREASNSGIDADFDKAVIASRGLHCWLFPDDDLLAPGAIATVLAEIERSDPDLIVVDAEVRDRDVDGVFEQRRLSFEGRREYGPADGDALMADLGNGLSFIGCAIIRRSTWMERDRTSYYGTLFVHAGVIFQRPPLDRVVGLGQSLIRIRIANAMWSARAFEIWMFMWPRLVWGFEGYGDAAKAAVTPQHPWRQLQKLLVLRAYGTFDRAQHRTFLAHRTKGVTRAASLAIALLPGRLAHLLTVTLLSARGHARSSSVYQLLNMSRFTNRASRAVARLGIWSR